MVNNDTGLSRMSNGPELRNRFPDGANGHYKPQGTTTGSKERRNEEASSTGVLSAASHATLPTWATMVLMVSMIFGGCCSNVFALEGIIKEQPSAGPLITFAQFILTGLFTWPSFLSFSAGPRALFLAPRAIPLRSWLVYTAFFVTVNLLNNWAFAYKISVPLHIIVRSAGPVASMVIGYIVNGRRYSHGQILAVAFLTVGVGAAALADAAEKGQSIGFGAVSGSSDSDLTTASAGFAILALAMVLSAFQGIYADRLYETHGRGHWREALFYSHVLSLPLFLPTFPQILSQWRAMLSSPPMHSTGLVSPVSVGPLLQRLPVQLSYLLVNILTQYLCIRGVHLLSARSSSLTVTIVLNIRKLVSLLLSIYLFGNDLATGVLVGAAFVFAGGGLYGFEGARLRKSSAKKSE